MKRFAILAAALLATTACTVHSGGNNSAAAEQPAAGTGAGVDLTGLDKNVKPGDNFDDYANGGWRAKTEIPADRASTGVFLEVFNKAEANNRAIIDAAIKANAAADSDQGRIANYYNAFMDTKGIEQRGLAPLKPELDAIAALKDKTELSRMLGANMRADEDPINATSLGTENLFGLFVTQALTDPDKTVPYVLQGGLGLPDRDYYISSSADMASIRDAYKKYIAQILTLAGISDAQARAQRIFDLETKLARAHATLEDTEQMSKGHDPWAKADFARKAPGIDWDAYWQAAGLPAQQDFIAWQPGAITGKNASTSVRPPSAFLKLAISSCSVSRLRLSSGPVQTIFFGRATEGRLESTSA